MLWLGARYVEDFIDVFTICTALQEHCDLLLLIEGYINGSQITGKVLLIFMRGAISICVLTHTSYHVFQLLELSEY